MHKLTTFLVLIFIASCGARPQDWLNNPVFQPGWNPVAAQPAEDAPAEPLGGEPEYVPVIPEAPLEEAYPASSGGELIPEKGSSSAGSTNEAASGKMDGALFASAQSDSTAQVSSLDKAKFQLAIGKGSAGAIAVEG